MLKDPYFNALHTLFQTKITPGIELIRKALERGLPFDTVLFDGWHLAPDLVQTFELADLTGTYVTLVTNRADWDATRIIRAYLQRWPFENIGVWYSWFTRFGTGIVCQCQQYKVWSFPSKPLVKPVANKLKLSFRHLSFIPMIY